MRESYFLYFSQFTIPGSLGKARDNLSFHKDTSNNLVSPVLKGKEKIYTDILKKS